MTAWFSTRTLSRSFETAGEVHLKCYLFAIFLNVRSARARSAIWSCDRRTTDEGYVGND